MSDDWTVKTSKNRKDRFSVSLCFDKETFTNDNVFF